MLRGFTERLPARAFFFAHVLLAAPVLVGLPTQPAWSQDAAYQPKSGQVGKDVVWVPTPQALVDRMLEMADAKPGEKLMDLGSGDGRTVITAAKRGLTAVGIEYNPDLVEYSRKAAKAEGVADKATFEKADLFQTDLSSADVITLFLLSELNERLRPTLLELKPGTRVVSNTFTMGDWEPDATSEPIEGCQNWCRALYWVVPAKVDGRWRVGEAELQISQRYQKISGKLGSAEITDAKLNGENISFSANGVEYTGKVSGDRIEGKSSSAGAFTAERI
jgi:Methyltransferase domain